MKKENIAILEMLLCAALWSVAGLFMKYVNWNGFAVAGARSFIAGITIASYMSIIKCRFVLSRKTLLAGVLTGCVYICFAVSNKLTTAANAIVLQFTSPVFIVVLSAIFLHKKIERRDAAVVVVTLLGIALFFFDQLEATGILGNIVAVMAGLFMAGMFICVGEQKREERFSTIVIGQCVTALVGLPFFLLTKPELSSQSLMFITLLGVFQLGISYIFYVRASAYCPPLACCLLGALEPLLNPVWVMLFYGEIPGIFAIIGGMIVITSVTVWCISDGKKENVNESCP